MTSETARQHEGLIDSIQQFLQDGLKISKGLSDEERRPAIHEFAKELAQLPSCAAVHERAASLSELRDYQVGVGTTSRYGRLLTPRTLAETGVAQSILDGTVGPPLASEVAAHLAGPAETILEILALDIKFGSTDPVHLFDDWYLTSKPAEELSALLPLPSISHNAQRRVYDPEVLAMVGLLVRESPEQKPSSGGLKFSFDMRPANRVWSPLLPLLLYRNDVVHLEAGFEVEPGRIAHRLHGDVQTEPQTFDGITEYEVASTGSWRVSQGDLPRFRMFTDTLRPLLDIACTPNGESKRHLEPVARLRRVVEHLIAAGSRAHEQGEVMDDDNADAVLHYVIALEGLLADSGKSDLTRKVAQRAAVLSGVDDETRLQAAETVRSAYRARSTYAHGGEPETIDLRPLRRLVRRCILARIVIGDPTANGELWEVADRALLSKEILDRQILGPTQDFVSAVGFRI